MKRNFKDCTPCRSAKAKFYNVLVNFYLAMITAKESGAIEFNASQSANAEDIQSFLDGHRIYPTIDDNAFIALKPNAVVKNRPIRKDKVAIYNSLVLFMESSLNDTDKMKELAHKVYLPTLFKGLDDDMEMLTDDMVASIGTIVVDAHCSLSNTDTASTIDEDTLAVQFIKERGLYDEFVQWCEE